MDEEDFRSADFMTPSPPSSSSSSSSTLPPANDTENAILRRKRRSTNVHHSIGSHIVYKRAALESESDYGKNKKSKNKITGHK